MSDWWTRPRWFPYSVPLYSHAAWLCEKCGSPANGVLYNLAEDKYQKSCRGCAEIELLNDVVNG